MTGSANSNARILTGECFCDAERFAVVGLFEYALNCHCRAVKLRRPRPGAMHGRCRDLCGKRTAEPANLRYDGPTSDKTVARSGPLWFVTHLTKPGVRPC
jgi:hypothetical protein